MKLLILFLILTSSLYSQDSIDEILNDENNQKDSICIKLQFHKNDTLEYVVHSHDSIVINFDEAIVKDRYERFRVVCEKVDKKNGHFFLSLEFFEFFSKESKGEIKEVERNYSPWVGKKIFIEIDSLGNRYSYIPDTSSFDLSSGGAFQPSLFQPFNNYCSFVEGSWLNSKIKIEFPENAYPVPVFIATDLFRNKGYLDTLDEKCKKIEFIRTGKGDYEINNEKAKAFVRSTINSHGQYLISVKDEIPIWFYMTQDQQMQIYLPGEEKKGEHFTTTTFTLDRFIRFRK